MWFAKQSERGQGMAEYVIILVVVGMAVLASIRVFGKSVHCRYSAATDQISSQGDGDESACSDSETDDTSDDPDADDTSDATSGTTTMTTLTTMTTVTTSTTSTTTVKYCYGNVTIQCKWQAGRCNGGSTSISQSCRPHYELKRMEQLHATCNAQTEENCDRTFASGSYAFTCGNACP